jgi:hypothetical protein
MDPQNNNNFFKWGKKQIRMTKMVRVFREVFPLRSWWLVCKLPFNNIASGKGLTNCLWITVTICTFYFYFNILTSYIWPF